MNKESSKYCPVPHDFFSKLRKRFLAKWRPELYNELPSPLAPQYSAIRNVENFFAKHPEFVQETVDITMENYFPPIPASHLLQQQPAFVHERNSSRYGLIFDLGKMNTHPILSNINLRNASRVLDPLNDEYLWAKLLQTYFTESPTNTAEQFRTVFTTFVPRPTALNLGSFIEIANGSFFQSALTFFSLAALFGPDFPGLFNPNQKHRAELLAAYFVAIHLSKTFVHPAQTPDEYLQRLAQLFSPQNDKKIPQTRAHQLLLTQMEDSPSATAFQQRHVEEKKGYYIKTCPAHQLTALLFASFGTWIQDPEHRVGLIRELQPSDDSLIQYTPSYLSIQL